MRNYNKFEEQCYEALENDEITKLDLKLLLKIAKAINEEDEKIKMELEPFHYSDRHSINCKSFVVDNFMSKIENAVEKAYVMHQNVSFGFCDDCTITIPTAEYSKSVQKAISERRDRNLYKGIAERRKSTSQFGDLIDYIVKLSEKGKYEKCDGIIEDFIRNYDKSQLITEEEMLNDLKKVIDGTSIKTGYEIDDDGDSYEYEEEVYNDEVKAIAQKYNTKVGAIKDVLEVKIRCFDKDYLYRDGFFDLNTQDHEIIKRKLKGEPWDNVEEFKLLSEIEL